MTKKYMMEDLGEELTIKELLTLIPIKESTLRGRLNIGNRTIDSLTNPVRKKRVYEESKKYGNSFGPIKNGREEDELFKLAMRKI
jgi:hypothetical protein